VRCDLLLPNNTLINIASCDSDFTYSKRDVGKVKLFIRLNETFPIDWEGKPNDSTDWTFPQRIYDFKN
jgi:hypothetical protein